MIIFHTVMNLKSGLGNYMRMMQIYNHLKKSFRAYMFVIADSEKEVYYRDHNEYHGSVVEIEKRVMELTRDIKKVYAISDLPFSRIEYINLYNLVKFELLFTLNDATVKIINADYFFNTDSLIEPPSNVKSYIGIEYQIIRNDILLLQKNNLNEPVTTIGVMFGGTDPGNLTEKFIAGLLQSNLNESYQFNFVLSENFDITRKNKLLASDIKGVSFFVNPDIAEFYTNINLFINMGGMSTYEALYLGIPVFSIEWSYMAAYTRHNVQKGYVNSLGEIFDSISILRHLLENFNYIIEKQLALNVVDGLGHERISNVILSTVLKQEEDTIT